MAEAVRDSLSQSSGQPGVCSNFYGRVCGRNEKSDNSPFTFSEEYSPLYNSVLEDLYNMSAGTLCLYVSGFVCCLFAFLCAHVCLNVVRIGISLFGYFKLFLPPL